MRNLQIYDVIENGKIYQFQSLYALDMFKRKSHSMSRMAHDVGMNPFQIVRVTKQATGGEIHVQYQTEFKGAIRSAYIDKHSVAFLSATIREFEPGEVYRAEACNKAYIITRYGQKFWDHIGVNDFVVENLICVPNPNAPELRLATIINNNGITKEFSLNAYDAQTFTSRKGFTLPKPVDKSSGSVRVQSLEIAPITNEKERLAAIKLLESIRYETTM